LDKPDLLLLHGALGSKSQFSPLIPFLENKFQIHTLDFEGHGGSPDKNRSFGFDTFAENVLDYLNENSIPCTHISVTVWEDMWVYIWLKSAHSVSTSYSPLQQNFCGLLKRRLEKRHFWIPTRF
jgi:hypothetical protein